MKSKAHKGLYDYAGRYKYLTFASLFLSGASAVLALMPFVYIWFMIRDVIDVAPNFAQAENLAYYGWMAVLFAVLAILVYVAGLMCSHIAAFRVAANIRKETFDHVVKLPVGAFDEIGSGKVRKIIDESSAATETYLAHNLPDLVGAIVTPLAMIAMMFVFDWRLGLASLFPVVCAFLIMTKMTGAGMEEKMKQYNDALMDMNNEAVEYVRGVPVVKTFGQTVFSFARFKASIDRYHKWVVAYTKQLRQPMMFFTLLIDSIFAFLIAVTLFIVGRGPADTAFIVDLVFYIIFTPILVVTLNKIMFMSENGMIVRDAMARINGVLDIKPLPESAYCESPEDNSVELKGVSFRYPNAEQNAVSGLNIKIGAGQTVALVGESGGGKTTVAGLVSRFWDVNEGEILIGGVNVKNIAKKVLSEQAAQGVCVRQCEAFQAECFGERGEKGAPCGAMRRYHRKTSRRNIYRNRQRGDISFRRRAAKDSHSPRHTERRADRRFGRGNGICRSRKRIYGAESFRAAYRGQNGAHDRAQADHGGQRRPHLRFTGRQGSRERHACRTSGE